MKTPKSNLHFLAKNIYLKKMYDVAKNLVDNGYGVSTFQVSEKTRLDKETGIDKWETDEEEDRIIRQAFFDACDTININASLTNQ